MAERSSSASGGKYPKLFQPGSDAGTASKSKKRRRKNQKKAKAGKSLEDVHAAESSELSTVDHSESNLDFKELGQNTGKNDENFGQEMESRDSKVEAQDSDGAKGPSDSHKYLSEPPLHATDQSEGNSATAKESELPKEEPADGDDKCVADESLEQRTSSKKTRKDLLSFGRSKRSKAQRAKSAAAPKGSDEKKQDVKDSGEVEEDSGRRRAKSKSLGKQNEQEPGDNREMAEAGGTSMMKEASNSLEAGENNEDQIDASEHATAPQDEMNAVGSNKAKKFKPLASFRRHKKKANSSKAASADEDIEAENEEKKQQLADESRDLPSGVKVCDEVFFEENNKVLKDEEGEKTDENGDNAKKSAGKAGKKFGPLRSLRRAKATKKSTEAEKEGAEKMKTNKHDQERGVEEENCHGSEVVQQEHDAKPSTASEGLSQECAGKEDPEIASKEEEVQDQCDVEAVADAEAMSPTKKEKKKSLLRRQMKKMWPTSGKNKEDRNVEKQEEPNAAEDLAKEENEVQQHGDQLVNSQDPQDTPAEPSSGGSELETEKLVSDQEENEPAGLATIAEEKIEKADEINLEAAQINAAEVHSTQKPEKTAGLFGRQIKSIKLPIKKNKEEKKTKKGTEEANLMEESTGANSADSKGITKQVKRKKSGLQKISNALKKKKAREEGDQSAHETECQAGSGGETQETGGQKSSVEVTSADEEQGPSNRDEDDADERRINEIEDENAVQSGQEETEKISSEEEESKSVERKENCQDASADKAHRNLMKPVIQELLAKMVKIAAIRAGAPAEPEVEPEENSELTKTSEFDDYSLTEVTSTTGDSSTSFADTYNDDKVSEDSAAAASEGKPQKQERNETEEDQGGKSSKDNQAGMLPTKDGDIVQESSECIPSPPEKERERNSADNRPPPDDDKSESPMSDAVVGRKSTSIPEMVANAPEADASGKQSITEDAQEDSNDEPKEDEAGENSETRRGIANSDEADNEESDASQGEQEKEMSKSEDLEKRKAEVTSDLESSQSASSRKGRKEEWILVNRLEMSQELSHQLKVLALDSFEQGATGCCSIC